MKFYVILFKYAGNWYRDVLSQEDDLPQNHEALRQWLIEATIFAVERQGLKKEGLNTVLESVLFEIVAEKKSDGSGQIGLKPIDAAQDIKLY